MLSPLLNFAITSKKSPHWPVQLRPVRACLKTISIYCW